MNASERDYDPHPHSDTFDTSYDFTLLTSTTNSQDLKSDCDMFNPLQDQGVEQITGWGERGATSTNLFQLMKMHAFDKQLKDDGLFLDTG